MKSMFFSCFLLQKGKASLTLSQIVHSILMNKECLVKSLHRKTTNDTCQYFHFLFQKLTVFSKSNFNLCPLLQDLMFFRH